jgi:hypothetical protein
MNVSAPEIKQPLKVPLGFIGTMAALVLCVLGIQTGELSKLRTGSQLLTQKQIDLDVAEKANRIALLKKIPDFGFRNLTADAMLIDLVQYFGGDDARKTSGYGLGIEYLDLILEKDPKYYDAYFFLSVVGSIYSGQPEQSIAIMNRGFKSIDPRSPERSYYLWRLKGTDELLFLGNGRAAQKSMQTAADWAGEINDQESRRVAALSQKTANFLAKNPKSKQAQFAAWMMVIDRAVDIKVKKIAVFKIHELGGKVELDSNGELKVTPPPQD